MGYKIIIMVLNLIISYELLSLYRIIGYVWRLRLQYDVTLCAVGNHYGGTAGQLQVTMPVLCVVMHCAAVISCFYFNY